jgi:hypothetical protein
MTQGAPQPTVNSLFITQDEPEATTGGESGNIKK